MHTTEAVTGSSVPRAHAGLRFLGGLAGIVVFLVSLVFSLGTALAAPFGMWAARVIARRKGRAFTGLASWIGAITANAGVIAIAIVVLFSRSPGTFSKILGDAQSARDQRSAQPTWVSRAFPLARANPNPLADSLFRSPAFYAYILILSFSLMSLLVGTIAGSAGWLAASLLGFAFTGAWG
ncbi:MAG: hypothetical protein ABJD11_07800 [Gemmatimonadota bacterium]